MVSFVCDTCQSTIKKPKVKQHLQECYTSSLSCIDCNTTFTDESIHQHTSCITEVEKYHGNSSSKKNNNKKKMNIDENHRKQENQSYNVPNNTTLYPKTAHQHNNIKSENEYHADQNGHNPQNISSSSSSSPSLQDTINDVLQVTSTKPMTLKRLFKHIIKHPSYTSTSSATHLNKDQMLQAITSHMIDNAEYIEIRWKKRNKKT